MRATAMYGAGQLGMSRETARTLASGLLLTATRAGDR